MAGMKINPQASLFSLSLETLRGGGDVLDAHGGIYGWRFVAKYLQEQYGLNGTMAKLRMMTQKHLLGQRRLNDAHKSVLDVLNTYGVAKTTVDEYHGSSWDWQGVCDEVHKVITGSTPSVIGQDGSAPKGINQYNFNKMKAPKTDAFFREFDNLAAHFFGEEPELLFFQIRHTFTDTAGLFKKDAIRAASWHVDHEGLKILKVFVNMTDVNHTNGPLRYLLKSNFGNVQNKPCHELMHDGRRRKVVPDKDTVCVTDKELFETFDEGMLTSNEGPPGTITVVDTSGTHKDGFSENARTVLVACFMPKRKAKQGLPWQMTEAALA